MNDLIRFLPGIFIPYTAERILKAPDKLTPAGRNLPLDFRPVIQYNNIIQPYFRSRYETKHYH